MTDDPVKVQGWNSTHPFFSQLVEERKPKIIIEVGSWRGASAIHMAGLTKDLGTKIYCVDTWLGGIDHMLSAKAEDKVPKVDGYPSLYFEFMENVRATGFADRIEPIPQTSLNAARYLNVMGVKAEMIYIDASHEYGDVLLDIKTYEGLLAPGGVMFGDDWDFTSVEQAVKDFASDGRFRVERAGPFWVLRKNESVTIQSKDGRRNIFLGVPMRSEVPAYLVGAFFQLMIETHHEISWDWGFNYTGSVAIARDMLTWMMLDRPHCEGILFADADMKWTPDHIRRLLSHRKPIVAAIYARKEPKTRWAMTAYKDLAPDENGLLEVHEAGTGLMWIAREVFDKIAERNPQLNYHQVDRIKTPKARCNFFFQGVVNGQFKGEDFGFCHFAREAGYKILLDTKCAIPHTGEIDFPLPDANEKTDYYEAPNGDGAAPAPVDVSSCH